MKKIRLVLLSLLLMTVGIVKSQDSTKLNKLSIGLNFGAHGALRPTNISAKLFTGITGDIRYMLNSRFGLVGDIGYERFSWVDNSILDETNLFRLSLQGVLNLRDILRFDTWTDRIGLLMHFGAGISRMSNPNLNLPDRDDLMGHFIGGLTPQVRLTNRISLNLDLSVVFNARQDHSFDFSEKNPQSGLNAFYMTTSAGIKIALGKNDHHVDWVATEFDNDDELIDRIQKLEDQLKDDDGDGIPNSKDLQSDTPEGSVVNSNGELVEVLIDSDNDGILDEFDQCPNEKGLFSTNGCPDSDNDGVIDSKDKCPEEFGSPSNEGCVADEETRKVFEEALHGINFEKGKDLIIKSSDSILQRVIEVMNAFPDYSIEIHGHADSGSGVDNLELSKARAKSVMNYLSENGIDPARMKSFGHGDKDPINTNKTDEGRADNRRVEFMLKY